MENLRPHHVVCLTRLYPALQLFTQNEKLYYDLIKNELEKSTNLKSSLLEYCKITWGTIYSTEVMKILSKVITDGKFITAESSCDSICSACYGKIDEKCVGEDRIQIMDSISTCILNLQSNVLTNVDLKDNTNFDKVCNICGTKDKCSLIRRAINNI